MQGGEIVRVPEAWVGICGRYLLLVCFRLGNCGFDITTLSVRDNVVFGNELLFRITTYLL